MPFDEKAKAEHNMDSSLPRIQYIVDNYVFGKADDSIWTSGVFDYHTKIEGNTWSGKYIDYRTAKLILALQRDLCGIAHKLNSRNIKDVEAEGYDSGSVVRFKISDGSLDVLADLGSIFLEIAKSGNSEIFIYGCAIAFGALCSGFVLSRGADIYKEIKFKQEDEKTKRVFAMAQQITMNAILEQNRHLIEISRSTGDHDIITYGDRHPVKAFEFRKTVNFLKQQSRQVHGEAYKKLSILDKFQIVSILSNQQVVLTCQSTTFRAKLDAINDDSIVKVIRPLAGTTQKILLHLVAHLHKGRLTQIFLVGANIYVEGAQSFSVISRFFRK